MAAIIEIMGQTVSYDGHRWTSEKPVAASICRSTAAVLPYHYYPDIVGGVAAAVAKALNGRVIHLDPIPPNDDPPDTIY